MSEFCRCVDSTLCPDGGTGPWHCMYCCLGMSDGNVYAISRHDRSFDVELGGMRPWFDFWLQVEDSIHQISRMFRKWREYRRTC